MGGRRRRRRRHLHLGSGRDHTGGRTRPCRFRRLRGGNGGRRGTREKGGRPMLHLSPHEHRNETEPQRARTVVVVGDVL